MGHINAQLPFLPFKGEVIIKLGDLDDYWKLDNALLVRMMEAKRFVTISRDSGNILILTKAQWKRSAEEAYSQQDIIFQTSREILWGYLEALEMIALVVQDKEIV